MTIETTALARACLRRAVISPVCLALGLVLLGLSAGTWSLAARYDRTFVAKRAAAPIKYDDGTITFLKNGRMIAVLLAGTGALAIGVGVALRRAVPGRRP